MRKASSCIGRATTERKLESYDRFRNENDVDLDRDLFNISAEQSFFFVKKTLNNWKICSEREWKKRFEQACEDKSKAILESLLNDYEAKFRDFETKIRAANEEIVRLRSEKSDRDQVIKKAFMRGVCALNVEAMSVLLKDKTSMFADEHFSNGNLEYSFH